jgi:hypothetical protein
MISASICNGQISSEEFIDFDIAIQSSFLTSNYSFGGSEVSCNSSWHLKSINILDSNGNRIAGGGKWFSGFSSLHSSTFLKYEDKPMINFRNVPKIEYYLLNQEGEKRIDTLWLGDIIKGKVIFEFDKEETKLIKSRPTFISQLSDGDTLSIKYDSYACGTYGYLRIVKVEDTYAISLDEQMGQGIKKTFIRKPMDETQISIIRDFELDCSRTFSNHCNDASSTYTFSIGNQTKTYTDNCTEFGGYYILKEVLFND